MKEISNEIDLFEDGGLGFQQDEFGDGCEVFVSSENTQYIWQRNQETIVNLTEEELSLLKFKVRLMKDEDIQNKESGNGVTMGIPVKLEAERFREIRDRLRGILENDPNIQMEPHAIDRLLEVGEYRGWEDEQDVIDCVTTAKFVNGVRLSVNHKNPKNTEKVKHLHTNFAIEIKGKKQNGQGRLVLVIFNENKISVVTIL
ncbi:hypothetical protein [Bacillus mojavensis]|uniref:hypothetical protein n=1 Tax=Bacillus mojavensis TaxID=72360 RepID=UPI002DB7C2A5|nr:hypothetical protein [Bacillus mojavensis]MEC1670581.1 hypothetical protein [Bacillus mojavensis]